MSPSGRKHAYHHGDLRATALRAAATHIAEDGPSSISLRGIAAELGVSHTALGHVFGSRSGLLTALAVEGFRELGARLEHAGDEGLRALGIAYVQFGLEWPAHFAVMFDGELDETDEYRETSARAWRQLGAGVEGLEGSRDEAGAIVAAWSLVHGVVTLHASGALARAGVVQGSDPDEVLAIAERAAVMLFGSER